MGSFAEGHGSDQTGEADGETLSHQDRELTLSLASLPSDPDLNTFLRCDAYISSKFIKIVCELQRLQASRSSSSTPQLEGAGVKGVHPGSGRSSMKLGDYFKVDGGASDTSKWHLI